MVLDLLGSDQGKQLNRLQKQRSSRGEIGFGQAIRGPEMGFQGLGG